jgi:hypothetical protein
VPRRAGDVVQVDIDLGLVDRREIAIGQDLGGRSGGEHPAILEQHEPIAVLGGEIQVVQHRDHAGTLGRQLAHAIEELDLVAQIEEARRLVEQQDRRLLGEGAREDDSLALARRQLVDRSRGEVQRAAALERLARDRQVPRRLEGEPGQVRMSPHEDDLESAEREVEARLLRHDRDATGDRLARQGAQVVAEDRDAAGIPTDHPRESAHQGALAGAVRPQEPDDARRRKREVDAGGAWRSP